MSKANRLSGIGDVGIGGERPEINLILKLSLEKRDNAPAAYRTILAWLHAFPQFN